MNTITLLVIEAKISSIVLIIMYKKYKIEGLYAYNIILIFLFTLMSLKKIPIYNYDINLGIIQFGMIFTSFNIVIQKKGIEETKKLLLTILSSAIISYVILLLVSYMSASNINLFTSASYDIYFLVV